MAPWNSTAAAMQMARCTKEEQASTVKRQIIHRNRDKLKQMPPPPHSVAIGTSSSIMSPLTSRSQSPTKQSRLSVASSTTTTTSTTTVEDAKRKPARVIMRRHYVVNAQHAAAENMRKRRIEDQAFLQAAALWKIERQIPDRKGRSARTIVGQVNKQLGTSVQEQTVRRRVNAELDKEPPRLGCGCKSSVPSGI